MLVSHLACWCYCLRWQLNQLKKANPTTEEWELISTAERVLDHWVEKSIVESPDHGGTYDAFYELADQFVALNPAVRISDSQALVAEIASLTNKIVEALWYSFFVRNPFLAQLMTNELGSRQKQGD